MGGLRQTGFAARGDGPKKSLVVQRVSALPSPRDEAGQLDLCNGKGLCYTQARSRTPVRLFPDSSAVEHSTVNRMVAGSNPAPGANPIKNLAKFSDGAGGVFRIFGNEFG